MNPITHSSSSFFYSQNLFENKVSSFLNLFFQDNFTIELRLISFSNANFKIRDSFDDAWVLRIPTPISHSLCHQEQEKNVLDWAFQEGISNLEVKGYCEKEGYLLTKFLEGDSYSVTEQNYQEALRLIQRVHVNKNTPIKVEFNPLMRYIVTNKEAAEKGIDIAAEIHELASQLEGFLSKIPMNCFKKVPCHNDPSPGNFFWQDGNLFLHDWELAGLNDPMWDLAHFSVLAQIEPEKIFNFYTTSDPLAREKINFFHVFILFNTIVWASLEREKTSSSLPVEKIEMLYQTFIEKANEWITSAPFETALINLTQGKDI